MDIEQKLYQLIKDIHEEINGMTPADGFSSPRDLELVREVNRKGAILSSLHDAMRVINPCFDIRE